MASTNWKIWKMEREYEYSHERSGKTSIGVIHFRGITNPSSLLFEEQPSDQALFVLVPALALTLVGTSNQVIH